MDPDNWAIVAGLRQADAGAFDRAYALYRSRLYGFLTRLTQDPRLAEDLLQDTWLRLAKHATLLSDDTDLCAWLFRVARNLYISHRRWVLLDKDRLRALRFWPHRDTEDTPFEHASGTETERRLEAAIGRLGPAYREILLLVVVERFAPHEVARLLRLSPETVRQRLSRARAMLLRELDCAGSVGASRGRRHE